MKPVRVGIAAVVAAILLAALGVTCARRLLSPSEISARLAVAIRKAKKELPLFEDRLRHPKVDDTAFFLRAGFSDSDHHTEYLWLRDVEPIAGGFSGKVDQQPFLLAKPAKGDDVKVKSEDVVDWTILKEDGSKEGDFTEGLEPNRH